MVDFRTGSVTGLRILIFHEVTQIFHIGMDFPYPSVLVSGGCTAWHNADFCYRVDGD